MDHKHVLMFPEIFATPKKESVTTKIPFDKSTIAKVEPQVPQASVVDRRLWIESVDEILTLHKETLSDLKALIKDDLHRAEIMIEELERKTRKIDRLGEEIEERRRNLVQEERLFRRRFISSLDENIHVKPSRNNNISALDFNINKENNEDHTFIDNIQDCVAIIQRGILKQVNRPFVGLLGYDTNEVVGKSLFDFISPECYLEIEKYYLDRLKGVDSSGYEAVFLTKDSNKLAVEINIRPTIFNGKKAEIAVFKKFKNR